MPSRYERLPNPADDDDNDELEAAFDTSDEEDDEREEADQHIQEQRPLVSREPSRTTTSTTGASNGQYDFERVDYDYPPPGSPPLPSSSALPTGAAYGNTNGLIPTSPVERPSPRGPAPRTWLSRVIPFYDRLYPSQRTQRRVGGGSENDGVFANLMGKPTRARRIEDEEGIHFVPEETQAEAPPSYSAAQADAVPSYWETTIHAPLGGDVEGELVVDSLPTGSLFSFLWSMLVSVAFSFLGFVLTYLLHTTHAAKYGSRAGLGITLMQYGWALRTRAEQLENGSLEAFAGVKDISPGEPGSPSGMGLDSIDMSMGWNETMAEMMGDSPQGYIFGESAAAWLSFSLMTLGWFLFLSSLLGFWRVKRWERGVLRAAPAVSDTTGQRGPDDSNSILLSSIGFSFPSSFLREGLGLSTARSADAEQGPRTPGQGNGEEGGERFIVQEIDRQRQIAEFRINDAHLHRNLRAAGLI